MKQNIFEEVAKQLGSRSEGRQSAIDPTTPPPRHEARINPFDFLDAARDLQAKIEARPTVADKFEQYVVAATPYGTVVCVADPDVAMGEVRWPEVTP